MTDSPDLRRFHMVIDEAGDIGPDELAHIERVLSAMKSDVGGRFVCFSSRPVKNWFRSYYEDLSGDVSPVH